MAKEKKPAPFPTLDELIDHFPDLLDALDGEEDVSVALLMGSYIDATLYRLLHSHFVSETQADFLLDNNNGPLNNSFRRASMAYALGMLSGNELDLIQKLCSIRNAFAHGWKERLTFESEKVAEKCGRLEYRDEWIPVIATVLVRTPSGTPDYRSLRDRFIHTSWALLVGILLTRYRVPQAKEYRPQN
jgi:hypothetical protein